MDNKEPITIQKPVCINGISSNLCSHILGKDCRCEQYKKQINMNKPEEMQLKIFELKWTAQGEREWVCARTNIEAIKFYLDFADMGIGELDDTDEIIEIPIEKWSEYKVNNTEYDENDPDDWSEKTFEEVMKDMKGPDIIAGTMYE